MNSWQLIELYIIVAALIVLKDKFTQQLKCSHYPLILMLRESLVKFFSPQNLSGPSKQNITAAFS